MVLRTVDVSKATALKFDTGHMKDLFAALQTKAEAGDAGRQLQCRNTGMDGTRFGTWSDQRADFERVVNL